MPTEHNTPNKYEMAYKDQPTQEFTDETLPEMRSKIAEIFTSVANDPQSKHGYSEEVIKITVSRSDVIRMDFVDLPGIVSYPPEAKAITMAMSQKYVKDQNCFILCVTPATTPRLTSYEPIACITAADACERSIIVLPMADKLSPKDYQTHLLGRVAMTSDELKGHKFSAVCAVVNRSNVSDCSLVQQADKEKQWFQANILGFMEKSVESARGVDEAAATSMADALATTRARVGINMLLKVTNIKYDNYIKTRWMPGTLDEIKKEIEALEKKLNELGVLPSPEMIQTFTTFYETRIHTYFWQAALDSWKLGAVTEEELKRGNNAKTAQWMFDKARASFIAELARLTPTLATKLSGNGYDAVPHRWVRFEAAYIPCVQETLLHLMDTTVRSHFIALYPSLLLERIGKSAAPSWIALLNMLAPVAKATCVTSVSSERALVEDEATANQRSELMHQIAVRKRVQENFEKKVLAMDSGVEDEEKEAETQPVPRGQSKKGAAANTAAA